MKNKIQVCGCLCVLLFIFCERGHSFVPLPFTLVPVVVSFFLKSDTFPNCFRDQIRGFSRFVKPKFPVFLEIGLVPLKFLGSDCIRFHKNEMGDVRSQKK